MRCDCCPLSDPEDVCPEAEGKYGLEHKDGALGCSHPRNWVEKRNAEYSEYCYHMGLYMGIEMDLSPDELSQAIAICEHMVGLDYKHTYYRRGKAFYRAFRNFYADVPEGNVILDKLSDAVVTARRTERGKIYHLTQEGLAWLGRQLHITIGRDKNG